MQENKNTRNAGRKKLYNEETVTISTVCPKSQESALRSIIKEFLDNFKVKVATKDKEVHIEPKINPVINNSFECGCYIESGLLKRTKGSKCRMSKQDHVNNQKH